jgi:hypothetical protein
MPAQLFEAQPYYDSDDEAVIDTRVLGITGKVAPTTISSDRSRQQHTFLVNQHDNVNYLGSDGDDYSGYIALDLVHTPEGRELAVVRSWQFNHDTGLPPTHHSWSAEFDDPEVAEDFWDDHWRPRFDGLDFVESAKQYLDDHPDTLRRSIRIQELGLLYPWHSQRFGEHVLLEKFSTAGTELVRVPTGHQPDDNFNVGQVYKVPENPYASRESYGLKTCLAAFIVKAKTGRFDRFDKERTMIQWSDGNLTRYSRPIDEGHGPKPLASAELN